MAVSWIEVTHDEAMHTSRFRANLAGTNTQKKAWVRCSILCQGHPSSWDYTRPSHACLHATHQRLMHFCNQTHISSWSVTARTRQWHFIGNMIRGDSRKWCFQLFRWIPLGERARGRPRMRFQDQFDQHWDHIKFASCAFSQFASSRSLDWYSTWPEAMGKAVTIFHRISRALI